MRTKELPKEDADVCFGCSSNQCDRSSDSVDPVSRLYIAKVCSSLYNIRFRSEYRVCAQLYLDSVFLQAFYDNDNPCLLTRH